MKEERADRVRTLAEEAQRLPSARVDFTDPDAIQVTDVGPFAIPDASAWLRRDQLVVIRPEVLARLPESMDAFVRRLASFCVAGLAVQFAADAELVLDSDLSAAAHRRGVPLVTFAGELPTRWRERYEQLAAEQLRAMIEAERLRRAATDVVLAGGSLSELARSLRQEFDAGVAFCYPDGRVLAWEGSAAGRDALLASPACDSSGRLRTETRDGAPGLHTFAQGNLAVAQITANRVDHGRLVLFTIERELAEPDLYAAQRAAEVGALLVARDQAVAVVEERHRANFVNDILLGRAGDSAHVISHARSFGWNFARPLVVLAIEPDPVSDPPPTQAVTHDARLPLVERQAMAFAGALTSRDPEAAVVALATETVIVMGAGDDVMKRVHRLVTVVRGDGGGGRMPFGVGVSRAAETIQALPAAYLQARTALTVGRRICGD